MKKNLILIVFSLCCSLGEASMFKGYKLESKLEPQVLEEKIIKFKKESKDFYIHVTNHAALFKFPVESGSASQISGFLKSRKRENKVVEISYDPSTMRIFKIEDVE